MYRMKRVTMYVSFIIGTNAHIRMKEYSPTEFSIPQLEGISEKQIEEHLQLYHGYVNKTNYLLEQLNGAEDDEYKRAELRRRFGFEFNGMRLHEYYFGQLEGGPLALDEDSGLYTDLADQWGSVDAWREDFLETATTRGTGWAVLAYDNQVGRFFNQWIDFHHQGHLGPIDIVFAVDVWEHAFMVDYVPSEKSTYLQKYFANINWEVVHDQYKEVHG